MSRLEIIDYSFNQYDELWVHAKHDGLEFKGTLTTVEKVIDG